MDGERIAECRCGRARALCRGEPVRISVCHCLACQRRTGSAFGAQARFPAEQVEISGDLSIFVREADSGTFVRYLFCSSCGSTIAYAVETQPDLIAIPMGAFADPDFPAPSFSVYEQRMHNWTAVLGPDVKHED